MKRKKKRTTASTEQQFGWWKHSDDDQGQRRMTGLIQANGLGLGLGSTVAQITPLYPCGEQKSISEHFTCGEFGTTAADHIRFHSCQPRTGI